MARLREEEIIGTKDEFAGKSKAQILKEAQAFDRSRAKKKAIARKMDNSTPRSREISENIKRGIRVGRETRIKHLHGEY